MRTPLDSEGQFAVILVRPKGAGNVGAIARAMAHFGLSDLRLVAPRCTAKSIEARSMAMSAKDILYAATHHATLADATRDCGRLIGASRRLGRRRKPTTDVREDAALLLRRAAQTRTALIFGSEDKGLETSELNLCQEHLVLPAEPEGESFNLSQAVMITLWELYLAKRPSEAESTQRELAPRDEVEGLLAHFRAAMEWIGFVPHHDPHRVVRSFRRLLDRGEPDSREVRMMRGVLRQMQWKINHILSRPSGDFQPLPGAAEEEVSSAPRRESDA
ncbi:MAG: RNA methyltransferase [bacterium]|nr:RNA methyltransferase [bacterium]